MHGDRLSFPRRQTPKERAWLRASLKLEVSPNPAHGFYCFRTRYVSRKHYVKAVQLRFPQSLVELADFCCWRLTALELLVCSMIACSSTNSVHNDETRLMD